MSVPKTDEHDPVRKKIKERIVSDAHLVGQPRPGGPNYDYHGDSNREGEEYEQPNECD